MYVLCVRQESAAFRDSVRPWIVGLDESYKQERQAYLGWVPSVRVNHQPFEDDSEANVLPPSSHLESSNMLPWLGPGSGEDDRSFKKHISPMHFFNTHCAIIDKSHDLFHEVVSFYK